MPNDPSPSTIRKPLYRQVADRIRTKYVEGKAEGMRLPAERDLIELLDTSSITIRAALRELESQGWIERRRGSGTYVLEPRKIERHVALLLEADVSSPGLSPYYLKLLQEVRLALLKLGISSRPYLGYLRLGVEIGELTCREFFEELRLNRISGVISILARKHPAWISELNKRSIPLVGTSRSSEVVVQVDHTQVAHCVLQYFQSRNYKRLALIGQDDHSATHPALIVCVRNLAAQYGISLDASSIKSDVSGLQPGEGKQAVREIWTSGTEKPDCLFVSCDLMADECLAEMVDLGMEDRVGMAVFGSDAVKLRQGKNLVRCVHSVATTAHLMAEAIRLRINHEEAPAFTEVPVSLQLPAGEPQAALLSSFQ